MNKLTFDIEILVLGYFRVQIIIYGMPVQDAQWSKGRDCGTTARLRRPYKSHASYIKSITV